jgi:hypothetical protein
MPEENKKDGDEIIVFDFSYYKDQIDEMFKDIEVQTEDNKEK